MDLAIDGYSKIIDKNFKEFCEIENEFDESLREDFFDTCKNEIITNIILELGISDYYDFFKDGGNVATVHNADKNIFPNEEIKTRYKSKYKDVEINYRNQLPKKRKEMFKSQDEIVSYGTGELLTKDGRTHLDHVISAKKIHDNKEARLYMSQKDLGNLAQEDINLKPLESSVNQSKGEHSIEVWSNKKRKDGKTNEEYFQINKKDMLKAEKESKKYIESIIRKNKFKEMRKGFIEQGSFMMNKEVDRMLIIAILEFTKNLFYFTKVTINEWNYKQTISDKISYFKEMFKSVIEYTSVKLQAYSINIIDRLTTAFGSGVISSLITFIINQFITTIKGLAKIINDSIHGLIRAFKVVVNRPNGISKSEALKEAAKIVSSATMASIGVVFSTNITSFLNTTPLKPMAKVIGSILGATLTGVLTGIIIYSIDNFRDIIGKIGKKLDSIFLYNNVAIEKLEETYKEALLEIDELYHEILSTMYKEYEKIGKLRELAYDFNALASMRHKASIEYAKAMGVNEVDIIEDENDLYNFLNN